MQRALLKSKIHRAQVTSADLDYEGSLTIDQDLMDWADIVQYEQISIYNVTNGTRFQTYAIAGIRGSGVVCLNGAAARMGARGDFIIIATYAYINQAAISRHQPKVVLLGPGNQPVRTSGRLNAVRH